MLTIILWQPYFSRRGNQQQMKRRQRTVCFGHIFHFCIFLYCTKLPNKPAITLRWAWFLVPAAVVAWPSRYHLPHPWSSDTVPPQGGAVSPVSWLQTVQHRCPQTRQNPCRDPEIKFSWSVFCAVDRVCFITIFTTSCRLGTRVKLNDFRAQSSLFGLLGRP